MIEYPRIEHGFFHLTPNGWVRQDHQPFPPERVETWSYELVCLAEDDKEQVCLRRVWKDTGIAAEYCDAMRTRFGEPLLPTAERNVVLKCDV